MKKAYKTIKVSMTLPERLMGDLAEYSQLVEESPATVVAHLIRRELQERKMAASYEEKTYPSLRLVEFETI